MFGQTVDLKTGRITKIRGDGDFHRKLARLGLFGGGLVGILNTGLQSEPVHLFVENGSLELSREEAAGISLDYADSGAP